MSTLAPLTWDELWLKLLIFVVLCAVMALMLRQFARWDRGDSNASRAVATPSARAWLFFFAPEVVAAVITLIAGAVTLIAAAFQ